MKVCVVGMWHLGSVLAAWIAQHTSVIAADDDDARIDALRHGRAPNAEHGLDRLLLDAINEERLSFSTDIVTAVQHVDVVWIAVDTPIDENDRGDSASVLELIRSLIPALSEGATLIISSQVPIGSCARIAADVASKRPASGITVLCVPENLRLGQALESLRQSALVLVGSDGAVPPALLRLLRTLGRDVRVVSYESAEMAKHALNAFLASCVVLTNEIATICEAFGADATTVLDAVRTDPRVGPYAYLRPGTAFSGGTLARDVHYLTDAAALGHLRVNVLNALLESNSLHAEWTWRQLEGALGDLHGKRITVAGVAYKTGTDATRRSAGLALCRRLVHVGAHPRAVDPLVSSLPADMPGVELYRRSVGSLDDADALVVLNGQAIGRVSAEEILNSMRTAIVVDPNHELEADLGTDPHIAYFAVGRPASR